MIGIVILNYNTTCETVDCVESIVNTCKIENKIYIVDNNSTDNSFQRLQDRFINENNIEILQSDKNGGYSYGNNIGIKKAIQDGCNYILISNPDVIFYDNTIDILYKDITSDCRIGVVGPSTPSLDQQESQLIRKVYTPGLYLCSKKPFRYLSQVFHGLKTEYDYPPENYVYPFLFRGMVSGCCFLISSKLFLDIGLFDDNIFLYSEEWIIAKKITEKGFYCAYDKEARALHKEATSTKKIGTAFQSYHLYLSAFYYLQEYCKCHFCTMLFFYLQNLTNYTIKSIIYSDYRKLYKKFVKTQSEMLLKKRKRIDF